MSQFDFATIDPNAKSGTQLAVDLNNWRDALHSGHRGAERPPYAQAGMLWVRETSAEQWDLMLYDGDTDFVLRSVNPTTNQLIGIPQSAVSGLSEIATATADLGGKADDLEVRAGELETLAGELATKAGELESGFADLEGGFQDLNSQIDFTIIYPNGGSEASPANASVNSRYIAPNPFPGHHVLAEPQLFIGGEWVVAPFSKIYNSGQSSAGIFAAYNQAADAVVTVTGNTHLASNDADGQATSASSGAINTYRITTAPFRVLVRKLKGAIV